jgi:mRNA interferase RelE/StbE
MALYSIRFSKQADKDMDGLPRLLQERVIEAAESLTIHPRPSGCKKMKGYKNRWRVRVGDYRIVYEVHDGVLVILVIRVAHRKEVYR